MRKKVLLYLILLALICFIPNKKATAQTGYESCSNIQFLYGKNLDPAGANLATITFEHVGTYGPVEHFGFTDILKEMNMESPDIYIEWYPKLSLGRIRGKESKMGLLNDVLLGGGINTLFGEDSDFFVWLAGPVWKFNIPGFDLFQLETYYYRQSDFKENDFRGTYQITPSWDVPFQIHDQFKFRVRGFVDFIGDRGPGKSQIIAQPQFLLDIGNFWNKPDNFFFGTEWRHWRNIAGTEGMNESIIQLELLVQF
jgi:nucleoside-specific outer membrane channel protein Tsx